MMVTVNRIFRIITLVILLWSTASCIHYNRSGTAASVDTSENIHATGSENIISSMQEDVTVDIADTENVTPDVTEDDTAEPVGRGGLKPDGYQLVPILCYNDLHISAINEGGISLRDFKSQMKYLKDNGFTVIPLSGFIDFIEYKNQLPEKAVVITVSDSAEAFEATAMTVLEEFGYPATLFVEPEDSANHDIQWEALRRISARGYSIQSGAGSDVDNSVNDSEVLLADYFDKMKAAIVSLQKRIEEETGKECVYYSFPSGKTNNLVINILMKYNFRGAFNLSGDSNPFFVDQYNISRIPVGRTDNLSSFANKLKTFEFMDLN